MTNSRLAPVALMMLLFAACDANTPLEFSHVEPQYQAYDDGSRPTGNEHFYFLPPLVNEPTYSGVFDPGMNPTVEISSDGRVVTTLPVSVDRKKEEYQAIWNASKKLYVPGSRYRVTVKISAYELGHVKFIIVAKSSDLRNIPLDTELGIVTGKSVTIRFRIEEGAVKAPFFLGRNGKTIMCPAAKLGDTGTVNGTLYTKRTREQLDALIAARNFDAVTTTCTSGINKLDSLFLNVSAPSQALVAGRGHSTVSEPSNALNVIDYDVTTWDVSTVTNMSGMFAGAQDFNQDISKWDVSNVTDMSWMFSGAGAFNQDISGWNTSKVTTMLGMFSNASAFNQNISTWDVSDVEEMALMFYYALAFNQPIGSWNVGKVTNMSAMFDDAQSFNQPIGGWNVSNVQLMSGMFNHAIAFNQPLNDWDVSNVVAMDQMFCLTESFNQPLDKWNLQSLEYMDGMFQEAHAFNQPLSNWRWGAVTSLSAVFADTKEFNADISGWDLSNIETTSAMFAGAKKFNQPLHAWNVSNISYMEQMFQAAESFNQDLSSWCVERVTEKPSTFDDGATSWILSRPNWGTCPGVVSGNRMSSSHSKPHTTPDPKHSHMNETIQSQLQLKQHR